MDAQQIIRHLSDVELFEQTDPQTLAEMAAAVEERQVGAGQVLFSEGDPGGFVFAVARGELEVLKRQSERDVLLRVMGRGQVGGLTSTTLGRSRSATLRARAESLVLCIPGERFNQLLSDRPPLTRAVVAFLSQKVRGKTDQLAGLMARGQAGAGEPVAFFDTKPYDRTFFDRAAGDDLAPVYFEARLRSATASLARGFRVVCAFVNDELDAGVLQELAGSGAQLIALRCAGFNNLDLEAAGRLGLTVVRVPAYSPHAVAEHTLGMILTLNRKIHRAHQRVREGNFSLAGLVGFDLHGRTAGVIGLGKIGRCLARVLRGLGMQVLAFDARPDEAFAAHTGVRYVALDRLLAEADIISLNAPLLPATWHMIDDEAIARMKPGVMLINTGRGALIDTAALIRGLKSGAIGSAGLDVYEEESDYFFEDRSDRVITDDVLARLLTFPNVLITSHQAFLTEEALGNIAETTAGNIRAFLAGARGDALDNRVAPAG